MAPMPTAKEFLDRLRTQYGVEIKEAPCEDDIEDDITSIKYLYREVDGEKFGVALPHGLDIDGDMMTWAVIRNVCDRLVIPRKDFGLTLG